MSRSPTMLAAASLLLLPTPTALAQQGGGGPPPILNAVQAHDANIDGAAVGAGLDALGALQPTPIDACVTIAESGSYRLTQNLTAAAGADCLVVAAAFVTLDLAGWAITGDGAAGAGISGRRPPGGAAPRGIAVRNGTVTGFRVGVALTLSTGAVVEAVRAIGNQTGIAVAYGGTVSGSTANSNGETGIHASVGSTVRGNIAQNNGITGIDAAYGSTVSGNTALGNEETGIAVGEGSTVSGNTARRNGAGIAAVCPSNIIGNTATANGGTNLLLIAGAADCNDSDNLAP